MISFYKTDKLHLSIENRWVFNDDWEVILCCDLFCKSQANESWDVNHSNITLRRNTFKRTFLMEETNQTTIFLDIEFVVLFI